MQVDQLIALVMGSGGALALAVYCMHKLWKRVLDRDARLDYIMDRLLQAANGDDDDDQGRGARTSSRVQGSDDTGDAP